MIKFFVAGGILILVAASAVFFLGLAPDSFIKKSNAPEDIVKDAPFLISEPPMPESPVAVVPPDKQIPQEKNVVKNTAAKKDPNCNGSTPDVFKCYRAYYSEMVENEGSEAAMADLKARYGNPFVRSQCHQLAHIVGRAAADIYSSVGDAYSHGDSFCWSGYYHGVMEKIVADIGVGAVPLRMNFLCSDLPGKATYNFDYYNCVHGLGHGMMYITNNELFQSLELCDNLSGSWEQSSCWSGAFMENIIADEVNHFAKYLKDDDPLYPCNAAGDKYKSTCYLMQTSRMLDVVGYDFANVFELCGTVGDPYVDVCYQSLGRDASGKSVSDVQKTRASCLLGKDYRQQSNCVVGAVKDFISYHHSDVQAQELCASLPQELQQTCFSTAESYYKLF